MIRAAGLPWSPNCGKQQSVSLNGCAVQPQDVTEHLGRVLWLVVCAEWVICRPGSNPCACETLDWMTMVAYRRYNVWYLTLLTILKEGNNCLVVFSLWKLTKNFFITHERMSRCWTVGNAFWKAQKSQYSCQCLTRELAGAQKNAAESCTALFHSYLEPICFSFSAM